MDGKIIGGISGDIELLCVLHIKTLWICETMRGKNIGTKLLSSLKEEAMKKGATFSYLETFDFQAKDFMKKMATKYLGNLNLKVIIHCTL